MSPEGHGDAENCWSETNPEGSSQHAARDHIPWLKEATDAGPGSRTIADLALNGAITLCTETLGYVHTISLRWALQRQGRLRSSSNLRLFTQVTNSAANAWYSNTASGIALIVTYTAASQTLLVSADPNFHVPKAGGKIMVNGIAVLLMGLGLLVQAGIAHLCFIQQETRIPTWSWNVLTITLACLHDSSQIRHRDGRCMLSTFTGRTHDSNAAQPQAYQPSLRKTDPFTHYILLFVWLLCPTTVAWAVGIAITSDTYFPTGLTSIYLTKSNVGSLFYGILLISAMQTFATLGLHSVELLVNRIRDEVTWRHAHSSPRPFSHRQSAGGAPKTYNSVVVALTSWQSIGLYVLKPIVHWLFGDSASELYADGSAYVFGIMHPPYTVALAAGALVVADFATALA